MSTWEIVFLVLGVLAVFVYLVYRAIKAVLLKAAEQINEQIYQSVQRFQDEKLPDLKDKAVEKLAGRGVDVVAIQQGVSKRIRDFAETRKIDLSKAKIEFFRHTKKSAEKMDSAVKLPIIGGIGLDAPLGWFFPFFGDLIGAGISVAIIANALQFGIPKELISRMLSNTFTDVLVGWIPLVGDVFDVFHRHNNKNMELLWGYLLEAGVFVPEDMNA